MVIKVVRMMSGMEIPSTPRWYQALKVGIQGARSTNCIWAVPASKSVHSSRLTRKVSTEKLKAIQREMLGALSPLVSTARPPMMGSQMASDRTGIADCMLVRLPRDQKVTKMVIKATRPRIMAMA